RHGAPRALHSFPTRRSSDLSERHDGTAIGLADLCAVVVLLICIQQAFGAEGISQLFQGSTGVFDPLKIQPFPGAMSGSDQVLLSEPAIDGVAVFVSEQSIQSPPVDCSRRRAAFHWSFDVSAP